MIMRLPKPFRRLALLMFGLTACHGPANAEPSDLPGHYYLSGMMEVGSELLLQEDGHFQWMLTYGALDMALDGQWSREGDIVTLIPDQQAEPWKAFKLSQRYPWDDLATRILDVRRQIDAEHERDKRCPLDLRFNSGGTIADEPDAPFSPEERRTAAAELEAKRRSAQTALDELSARTNWQTDRLAIANADALMEAYHNARGDNAMVASAPLSLPEECLPDDWQAAVRDFRGVLVTLFDVSGYTLFNGTRVEARYDTGAPYSDVVTGGLAFLPLSHGQKIVALALYLPDNDAEPVILETNLSSPAMQTIDANPPMIPPLERLRLTVDPEGNLIPLDGLDGLEGSYRKTNDIIGHLSDGTPLRR